MLAWGLGEAVEVLKVVSILDDDVMHDVPLPRCLRQAAVPPEFNATFPALNRSTVKLQRTIFDIVSLSILD